MKTIKTTLRIMIIITLAMSIALTIKGKQDEQGYKEIRRASTTIALVSGIIYMADPNPKKKKEKLIQEQDIQRIPENDSETYTTIDI